MIKVSVIIPAYNSEKFIREAVFSVLNQSLKPREILVIDDGSTDQTGKIVKDLVRRHKTIEYVYQKNRGLSVARNTGIKKSQFQYIAFLDSDDVWKKNKLRKQALVFQKTQFPKLGLVYCDYNDISTNGKVLKNYPSFKINKNIRGNVFKYLLSGNKISGSGSGVLAKKECFEKAGLFDEKLITAEDWEMWLRISKKFSIDYVDEILVSIRRHPENMSSDNKKMIIGISQIAAKHKYLLNEFKFLSFLFNRLANEIIEEFPNVHILSLLRKKIGKKAYLQLMKRSYLLGFYLIYNLAFKQYRKLLKK